MVLIKSHLLIFYKYNYNIKDDYAFFIYIKDLFEYGGETLLISLLTNLRF